MCVFVGMGIRGLSSGGDFFFEGEGADCLGRHPLDAAGIEKRMREQGRKFTSLNG